MAKKQKYRRQMLRREMGLLKQDREAVFRRYVDDLDPFLGVYGEQRLLQPKFDFTRLYEIYEQSDMLQECVEAMVQNVDGFGYELVFLGDDIKDKDNPEVVSEETRVQNFFDQVNDEQSFRTIRKLFRADYEVLGCGAFEIIRNLRGEVQMIFHMPMKQLRMTQSEGRPVTVTVEIMRDGRPVQVQMKKYFRKFCQLRTTGAKVRFFKQYGDPRTIDAIDGLVKAPSRCKMVASEILFIKHDFGNLAYGLPRWMGALLDTLGRTQAQYVNWDLFESQGIPPIAVLVSGGVLTDESLEDLEELIRGMRGYANWNKAIILESTVETVGMEDKGTAKIELKNLTEYRKEDQMFDRYLEGSAKSIRRRWRIPPLYVGGAETFTHATARAAQSVAEEQVFIPEREGFDEIVNTKLVVGELNVTQWYYTTKGPQIVGADEISKAVGVFSRSGALTVNHAIQLANKAFNLQMSKFTEVWANYPLQLVLKLIELGRLKNIDAIDMGPAPLALPAVPQQKTLPHLPTKVFKSDMFTEEERALYKRLLTIQHAVEIATDRGVIDEAYLDEAEAGGI
jgi:PBSX family phage portal protein